MDNLNSLNISNFSLEYTLNSGQFFLYEKIDDWYYIILKNVVFKVKQEQNKLFFKGIKKEDLIHFLSLDIDLKKLTKEFENDLHLKVAKQKYDGLRLMRVDLFQTIISFVLSSASNIAKIKKNLKLLCKEFGEKVEFENMIFYTFPKIGTLNDLEKIKSCKCGFRSKYIYSINEYLIQNPHFLEKIKSSNYNQAKQLLIKLPGIGPKVADCICLFALGHDAFPIDTWIKQIIEKLYLNGDIKTIKQIEQFININFKQNKGIKQQYLFHYARNNDF